MRIDIKISSGAIETLGGPDDEGRLREIHAANFCILENETQETVRSEADIFYS
jgi:hypothetical protein